MGEIFKTNYISMITKKIRKLSIVIIGIIIISFGLRQLKLESREPTLTDQGLSKNN